MVQVQEPEFLIRHVLTKVSPGAKTVPLETVTSLSKVATLHGRGVFVEVGVTVGVLVGLVVFVSVFDGLGVIVRVTVIVGVNVGV